MAAVTTGSSEQNGPALEPRETQARRFGRAREARSTEVLEDYAELIDDLVREGGQARATEIARRLGVSHVTAVKAVARLEREGFAKSLPYRGVTLTEAGVALAARVRARHLLVVDLLVAVGVPLEDARADAEGIEHHVSPGTLAAFARFLGKEAVLF
jgi:DtxR family manganese transport transcriptional regulator